jgi:hypothetical protein
MKNASIVEVFLGAGFVIAIWVRFVITPDGFLLLKLLISTLD